MANNVTSLTPRVLFFDTGPIISLVMSRLVWILPLLKKQFNGRFYITPAVRKELVERPLLVKRFEFEALQVLKLIKEKVLEEYSALPKQGIEQLFQLASQSFSLDGVYMEVLQSGEVESVASAAAVNAAVVIDERTLRLFIENSAEMEKLLEMRFQKNVSVNSDNVTKFSSLLNGLTIIRSVELVAVAYKLGLLDSYLPEQKNAREILLDAVLWSTKYNGCAVTEDEIEAMKKFLLR